MQFLRILLATLILLACAGMSAADDARHEIRLQLQWTPQTQFAGYYVAQALGFYADEGLAVIILPGGPDAQPVDAVASGDAEFGVTWLPNLLLARQAGHDLVNIAQVFQRSGSVMISFADNPVESLDDMALKSLGYWPGSHHELYAATFKAGSDPVSGEHMNLVAQPFDTDMLLNGELDAVQALVYNGYGALLEMVNPDTGALYRRGDFALLDFNEVGVAMLQDGIIARADWLAQPGSQTIALKLLTATFRAWIHCRDHADDCVRILLEVNPSLGESHQRWMMNEVNKLIWSSPAGLGMLDEALYAQTVHWLQVIGALEDMPLGCCRMVLARLAVDALLLEGLDAHGLGWQPLE